MLRSMTGFGAASSEAQAGSSLRVEIRAVNHRHLALKTRLPDELAALEHEIEGRVRARCERGAVSVHVFLERSGGAQLARLDREAARLYQRELGELARELQLAPELSLATLLGLPGVVAPPESLDGSDALRSAVLRLVDEALQRLLEMRAIEGTALAADLRKNARAAEALVGRVEKRMPAVVRSHQTSLERRLKELLGSRASVPPADLAREVALLADRLDVSEEIARLKSHLVQLEALLERGGRIGRELDFLVQEIFREVNTIGAKCSDAKVAHWVIAAKTHVERLREQVQNVE